MYSSYFTSHSLHSSGSPAKIFLKLTFHYQHWLCGVDIPTEVVNSTETWFWLIVGNLTVGIYIQFLQPWGCDVNDAIKLLCLDKDSNISVHEQLYVKKKNCGELFDDLPPPPRGNKSRRNIPVKKWLRPFKGLYESALYHTALIRNQRCIRQRWYGIGAVWYSPDSDLALYLTTLISVFKGMFLPNNFSFEAMSSVRYSADSDLTLYPTTLIQN
jgi:hypothetical protein